MPVPPFSATLTALAGRPAPPNPLPDMDIEDLKGWYLKVLRQYSDFNGRARRREYWMFTLANVLVIVAIGIVAGILGAIADFLGVIGMIAYVLYALAVFIPGIAVAIRRLHDTGKSGWFLAVALVPFVGGLIVLYFLIQEGEPGPNLHGPDPKTDAGVPATDWNA